MTPSISKILVTLTAVFLLAACNPQEAKPTDPMTSEAVVSLLDELFMEELKESPEYMTYLGMRERYDEWDDRSDAARDKQLEMTKRHLAIVKAIDQSNLNDAAKLNIAMFIEQSEQQIEADKWRYHSYPINQMRGVHSMIPSFLINQHLIADSAEAQAYIGRIAHSTGVIDQLLEQLKVREEKGIVPPKFVFPLVLKAIDNIISGAPFSEGDDSTILADFSQKVRAINLSADETDKLIADARAALQNNLAPSYQKLRSYLTELEAGADDKDGVWKFPEGEAFYNFALKRTTTTDLTANEIHDIGLAEVARIQNEMRQIMQKVGFAGDLKAFFDFTRNDAQFYYPETAEGKQAYIDEATALINTMKGRLDELFITKPKADLLVKAVEPFREASAGQAFYQSPAPDGSRPGTYFANLYRMSDMAKYQMESLAYHEGIPGHHMQISIAQELENMPKFRLFGGYTVFSEGWGLYSELVPKEIGMYSDPYADFGRLSGELYRACRLVVDTGIHAKRWSREKALAYMADNVPHSEGYNVRQIERYIVMPSQATAYKIGMLKILELRATATEALGDKFDIRQFHDVVLRDGSVSLSILENNVKKWIVETQAH
ncbi:MAG: hypothetical protein ABS22_02900 [SAR92 bacterium BACL16 MAG-120322-bin99]|jgi:uncharacterized protein (DUF885 family)|nr:MAG: hypothetical protein ABS23_01340 [SAR92 bacterium BACL16 MAG-120619-bin48]KRP26542.1 MAG: hypothetical protein ABS22_02900 [SAR92 bacterium BACL16 MAG-120322-bin99]